MSDPHPSRPFRGGDKHAAAPAERRTLFQKLIELIAPGPDSRDQLIESLADAAQFVTVNGAWTTNRADYLDLMQRLHGADGPFRLSTRETPEMHLRFLAPDIAMMHSRFHIHGDIDESVRVGIGTRVVAQDRWTVAHCRRSEHRCTRWPTALMI